MTGLLLGFVGLSLVVLLFGRSLGRNVFLLCALGPAGGLIWVSTQLPAVWDHKVVSQNVSWVAQLGLDFDFRLDGFSALMTVLITGIGVLVFVYSRAYFEANRAWNQFAATLLVFSGSMLGLVLSDNVFTLFVFWELTSVTSYLLIATNDTSVDARGSALQAFLMTGGGGLVMLAGLVILAMQTGTVTLSGILAAPPTGTMTDVALLLVLVGCFTKSAQVPFHSWLPRAMAGPTPVSAYLHSATMVKAGIYLMARFAPVFADTSVWRPAVLVVGGSTMVLGGWRALRQYDLKSILAYGTISQLGFLTVCLGAGFEEAVIAGVTLLFAHALFKAALFLLVGIVDHETHDRDIRHLSGLANKLPTVALATAIAAASMAGVPLMFGFIAKESAYDAFVHSPSGWGGAVLATVVFGSILTFAYSSRLLWGAFGTKPAEELEGAVAEPHGTPTAWLVAPPAILAVLTVMFGVVPAALNDLIGSAAQSLDGAIHGAHLALWHGVTTALLLSLCTIAAGVFAFIGRRAVSSFQQRLASPYFDTDAMYQRTVWGLRRFAPQVAATVQSGSLPVYLTVILATVVGVSAVGFASGAAFPETVWAENTLQFVLAVTAIIFALAAARSERRFAAALCLGGVGYCVAALFLVQGAPDLALTQLAIETLSLVVFVLFLRLLPKRFRTVNWRPGDISRVGLAVLSGTFVSLITLITVAARNRPSVAEEFVARAYKEAGGHNVVNVILVDFRGYDTQLEITVLSVAALGVFALVRAARRDGSLPNSDTGDGAPGDGPPQGTYPDSVAPAAAAAQPEITPAASPAAPVLVGGDRVEP
jgi:multicomponent Na+:H+ antiporter subunit A